MAHEVSYTRQRPVATSVAGQSALIGAIDALDAGKVGYWDGTRGPAARQGVLYRYPAMMVPEVQGAIIDVLQAHGHIRRVLDPFSGSGTVLAESMWRGYDVVAQDINPLSTLLCTVRRGPYFSEALAARAGALDQRIKADTSRMWDHDFPFMRKWFHSGPIKELCRIRRNILAEESDWARRFFWVALAQTVRSVCNSRATTYKLHKRAALDSWKPDVLHEFSRALTQNLVEHERFASELRKDGLLESGHYTGRVWVSWANTTLGVQRPTSKWRADLVVTSPPYGDNRSTVPYGQNSYLPLKWIDESDLERLGCKIDVAGPSTIDAASIGGRSADAADAASSLFNQSKVASNYMEILERKPADAKKRFLAFAVDFVRAVDATARATAGDGKMIWTVGNRTLRGTLLPLDGLLVERLEDRGFELLADKGRRIRHKRMAPENSVSATMTEERILVFGGCN